MAGDSKAKVIPLHGNSGRAAAQRRAGQRTQTSRQHPSLLSEPDTPRIRRRDRRRRTRNRSAPSRCGQSIRWGTAEQRARAKVSAIADFLRHRLTGDYSVDEFGFDPHFNDAIVRPLLRFFFKSWFRVEVSGIEHLPDTGAGLVVANHAGVLPFDGLMASVAVHDEHPAHGICGCWQPTWCSTCRWCSAAARKAGHTMACTADAHRLLAAGELTAVFPEGYKGLGKRFKDRYKLQRFGRGGFVAAALRAKAPIIPCSIVGSEEIYPMLTDVRLLARCSGCRTSRSRRCSRWPVRPGWCRCRRSGTSPSASRSRQRNYEGPDAEDPMVTFELTDQVRETIQQTLYQLLAGRRNMFFG